jgi:hypothetical protein
MNHGDTKTGTLDKKRGPRHLGSPRPLQGSGHSVTSDLNETAPNISRRTALRSTLVGLFGGSMAASLLEFACGEARAEAINPNQTFVVEPNDIQFKPWQGLPQASGEMAMMYGDLNKPGPYLVLMKWNPGWFSAPHNYGTDRICVVVSGTWWVNSGADFTPAQAVPVHACGFVLRHARTWHYDGVPAAGKEPVIIAVFGMGPVDIRLVDPAQPSWRRV